VREKPDPNFLEFKALSGTPFNDPSYDWGFIDGLQTMFQMVLKHLKRFADTQDLLDSLCRQDGICFYSWLWEFVIDKDTGETLGEYVTKKKFSLPEVDAEAKVEALVKAAKAEAAPEKGE
jgi:hypothetical protein